MSGVVLGFNMEWFDHFANMIQKLYLKFFVDDNTIEILTDKSCFLKRIYYPDVKFTDLSIGNTLTIHTRLYTINSYANKFTSEYMESHEVHYIGVIPFGDMPRIGRVLELATRSGLNVSRIFTTQLDASIESNKEGDAYISVNPTDTVVELVGITMDLPNQRRSASSKGNPFDNFPEQVARINSNFIFAKRSADTIINTFKQCRGYITETPVTLCLVKPHIFKSTKLPELLTYLQQSYNIHALFSVHLTIPMAEEFFEVYRGVVHDYAFMIESMSSGPVLAIAVTAKRDSVDYSWDLVSSFREYTGPTNPELAKILRPNSLRALFGENSLHNAVHCTDLPDDGEMECKYFFETLANL